MSSTVADSSAPGEFYCPICEQAFAFGGTCPTDGNKLIRLGAEVDPFLGRDLDDKYTILEKLGQGGMGSVYRAEQRGLDREVAIKVVHAQRISSPDVIKRFFREAKLASRLGHPNAVGVIDFGQTEEGVCYLVMELVAGRTLQEVFEAEGVLPPERLVRIAVQICDALECAHALQIVHRDLKPSNAMLLAHGRDFVKILDFGLAKSVASDDATPVTITGALLGTPAYMAPELALGKPCDGRADLYSLGVMLYQLGSGRLPFQSSSPHELISLHGNELAPAMTGVPRALAKVIDRLLRKDPADRHPTAAAVREALERALVESGAAGASAPGAGAGASKAGAVAATAVGATGAPAPRAGRRRRWLAPVVAGSLAVAGGAGYLLLARGSSPAASGPPRPARAEPPADAAPALTAPTAPAIQAATPPAPADTAPGPAVPGGTGADTPSRPASPRPKPAGTRPKPASPRPKPARPAEPPRPGPTGAGSARGDGLPF